MPSWIEQLYGPDPDPEFIAIAEPTPEFLAVAEEARQFDRWETELSLAEYADWFLDYRIAYAKAWS